MYEEKLDLLHRYQSGNFKSSVVPHPPQAYPETATGIGLDKIAKALEIKPREFHLRSHENDDEFRHRIIGELA